MGLNYSKAYKQASNIGKLAEKIYIQRKEIEDMISNIKVNWQGNASNLVQNKLVSISAKLESISSEISDLAMDLEDKIWELEEREEEEESD